MAIFHGCYVLLSCRSSRAISFFFLRNSFVAQFRSFIYLLCFYSHIFPVKLLTVLRKGKTMKRVKKGKNLSLPSTSAGDWN